MVREAEEFADEDAAVKKKIEALNGLQVRLFSTRLPSLSTTRR